MADSSVSLSAVLFLKGYGHLALVEPDRAAGLAYTLADPDFLGPFSPLLEGDISQFRITKYQCVKLVRHALEDERVTSWKPTTTR